MKPAFIKAGPRLIPLSDVADINIADVEWESVTITTRSGEVLTALGFDAIEAVMLAKPSALEGLRLRWNKSAWAFHNLFGHPAMQILAWLGFKKTAIWLHDVTTPTPRGFR